MSTTTGNGSLDVITLSNFKSRELGTILALLEKGPTLVAQIVAQLNDESGPLGAEVVHWYNECRSALGTVPLTKTKTKH
jgi:hypothetical protein